MQAAKFPFKLSCQRVGEKELVFKIKTAANMQFPSSHPSTLSEKFIFLEKRQGNSLQWKFFIVSIK